MTSSVGVVFGMLPDLIVLIALAIAGAIFGARSGPGRALVWIGTAVLALRAIVSIIWQIMFPFFIRTTGGPAALPAASVVLSVVNVTLLLAGIGLLMFAIVAGRGRPAPASPGPSPAPNQPPPGPQWAPRG